MRNLDMDGVKFTDVRCRVAGPPQATDDFRRNAEYRQVPFAMPGMKVMVDDQTGVIVGHNSSANWDVLFDHDSKWPGIVLNCHPNWEIVYFDDNGKILADFRRPAMAASEAVNA